MLAIALVIIGIVTRLMPHMSQFTALLAVAMFGGMYLNRRQALILPLAVMIGSDMVLGFHDTMFFTWGSMFLITCIGFYLREKRTLGNVFAGSLCSALIFFVVTNFGAWLTMYPHNFAGFAECYTLALPFFRTTLFSTVIFSLVLFVGYESLLKRTQGTAWARLM
jgi:hypothetical protein